MTKMLVAWQKDNNSPQSSFAKQYPEWLPTPLEGANGLSFLRDKVGPPLASVFVPFLGQIALVGASFLQGKLDYLLGIVIYNNLFEESDGKDKNEIDKKNLEKQKYEDNLRQQYYNSDKVINSLTPRQKDIVNKELTTEMLRMAGVNTKIPNTALGPTAKNQQRQKFQRKKNASRLNPKQLLMKILEMSLLIIFITR